MSCKKAEFIQGYLDGELDLAANREAEQHLQECTVCANNHLNLKTLRSSLKSDALYYSAPDKLKNRIQTSLRKEAQASPPVYASRWLKAIVAFGLLAIVGSLTWMVVSIRPVPTTDISQEVVSNHIRSLLPVGGHLTDVLSTDQHTVKPWFDGKVDFAPPVRDFPDQDFHLYGGRLEYMDHRTVATLVYQRRLHFINLYIWPNGQSGSTAETTTIRQGYNLIHWSSSGMNFWAVSDLSSIELREFARLVQQGQ